MIPLVDFVMLTQKMHQNAFDGLALHTATGVFPLSLNWIKVMRGAAT